MAQKFKIELRNRFSSLADDEANNIDDHTRDVGNDEKKNKKTYHKTAEKVLGSQSRSSKSWISAESCRKIEDRRELKREMDSTTSERVREQRRKAYSAKKEVKKQVEKDKNDWQRKSMRKHRKLQSSGTLKQSMMLPENSQLRKAKPWI